MYRWTYITWGHTIMKENFVHKSFARGRAMHWSLAAIFYGMALVYLIYLNPLLAFVFYAQGRWHHVANKCALGMAPILAYATTAITFLWLSLDCIINMVVLGVGANHIAGYIALFAIGMLAFIQTAVCVAQYRGPATLSMIPKVLKIQVRVLLWK